MRENGNKEAAFNVSKLTVFCVEVYSNEEEYETSEKTSEKDFVNDVISSYLYKSVSKKTSEKVIEAIRENPKITAVELSQKFGVTRRTIELIIKSLRENGVIKREGGRKIGHWEIVSD